MSNYSLLLMSGNAKVGEDYIDYIGAENKRAYELPQEATFPPPPVLPADIRSNIIVNDGELRLTYQLNHSTSSFSVYLWGQTDNLVLTFNESPFYLSVKRVGNNNILTPLYPVGSSSATKIDLPVKLSIQNNAGVISVSVDEVVVVRYPFPNNGLSVNFMTYGAYGLTLRDILVKGEAPKAFVVMQFQQEYNELYKEVIKPVCESMGLEVIRADESLNNGSIIEDILTELTGAKVIIADITPDNPNVYYEVGYAHALKKNVILMCNERRGKLPFDLVDVRTIFYKDSIAGNTLVKEKLQSRLSTILGENTNR